MPRLDRLSNIQDDVECYCLDLRVYPEVSQCPSSPILTVESAQNLAQQLDIPLQALDHEASARSGIQTILGSGNALSKKQIVCGKGDAVQREFPSAFEQPHDPEAHEKFVDRVGSSSILLLLLVVLGNIVWKRFGRRRRWYRLLSQRELSRGNDEASKEEKPLHENEGNGTGWGKTS
ncbi:hypothetical protein DPSP01_005505 [Paraphaeosphaeria sporulosa]|uniref:Uncharacterized protein n=1 Tax=Paraphaeosphaeria sporulosa TaxID=1460663 RepID=A0A177CUP9_9PLEO|nr:uncharacterized protein CC84DRAFT_1213910 [Paraphaeosphaeria sporulosa]OAG10600.1 hypothetical protein CC84DRAFT_1213910 [Paraphaeosphaeria sporulosa]